MAALRILSTVAVVLCATGCCCDTIDSAYATLADAAAQRQIEKGWIPTWVPPGATNLREVHNIDCNASALSFALPPGVPLGLPPDCAAVAFEAIVPVHFDRRWWPRSSELAAGYSFFRCRGDATDHTFVAVRNDASRVLHWRTHAR